MAITVQNIWDDIKARVKNVGDISITQQLRRASIVNNDIRNVIESVDATKLISQITIGIVSGTTVFTIPSDFEDTTSLNTGIFTTNSNGDLDKQLPRIAVGSQQTGWYIDKTTIFIRDNSATSLTLRYIPNSTELSSLSDTFIVNEKYRELIETGVLVQYYKLKGEFKDPQYANWSAEYASLLNDFADDVMRSSGVFTMPDIISSYSGHSSSNSQTSFN